MSEWERQGRTILFKGTPIVFVQREETQPVIADAIAVLLRDVLNASGATPDSLYKKHMGGDQSVRRPPARKTRNR